MTQHGLIDRRGLILFGTGGTIALATPAGAEPLPDDDFKALMAALEQLGDQLPLTARGDQEAYTLRLAALGVRVREFPVPKMGPVGRSGVQIGPLARTEPPTDRVHGVALVSYRLAPNALLQPHNHPNYSVATIGVEGEARVTHYEPGPDAPPFPTAGSFAVRKTAERVLRPGEATTLSPARDNIHTFRAGPNGARFVDLFSVHGTDVGFSYLDIGPAPTAPGGDSFRARWVGERPTNA